MSDDLDARIAQLQGLIGDDETAQRAANPAPTGFGRPPQQGSVFANQGSQAGVVAGAGSAGGQPAGGDGAPPRFARDADERSIFVGNLPKTDETAEEVANLFVHCGVINKVTLLRDRSTQALKGQAYIEFASHEATGKALDTMQNAVFRGANQLIVTKKRSKFDEARTRGGGRGGRGMGRGGAGDPMAMMMQAFAQIAGAAGVRGMGRGRGRGAGRGRGNFGDRGGGGNFAGGGAPAGGGNFGGGGGGGNFGGPPPPFGAQ